MGETYVTGDVEIGSPGIKQVLSEDDSHIDGQTTSIKGQSGLERQLRTMAHFSAKVSSATSGWTSHGTNVHCFLADWLLVEVCTFRLTAKCILFAEWSLVVSERYPSTIEQYRNIRQHNC